MDANKRELEKLYSELEKYKYIMKKLDDPYISEKETDQFIQKNKLEIQKMNILRKKISDIEWYLLSPEQQKDYLEKYSED